MSNTINGYEFEGAIIKEIDFSDDELTLILEKDEGDNFTTYQLRITPEYHYSRCGDVERYIDAGVSYIKSVDKEE